MRQRLRRFVVERRVPEMNSDDLDGLHTALAEASHRLSADSREVVCVRTIYLPSLERWIAVFAADAADSVQRAAKIAQLPPGDVHEGIEMTEDGYLDDARSPGGTPRQQEAAPIRPGFDTHNEVKQ
jgi:hypothetical protein